MTKGSGRRRESHLARRVSPTRKSVQAAFRDLLEASGLGPLRGDLRRTPARAAGAWLDHLLSGYRESPARILEPLRSSRSRNLVAVREIEFVSTCVHHLLPFHGWAHVAYLPDGLIVGVSRLAALVRCLSRRLQIQEDLTSQIATSLHEHTESRGAVCLVEATHLCMAARETHSRGTVITAAFTGCYETDPARRAQVLRLLGAPRPGRRRGRR